jgi:hypothetical protein
MDTADIDPRIAWWRLLREHMSLPDEHSSEQPEGLDRSRHRVRLPRFLVHEPVGLGTTIKRVTDAVGVRPCSSCEERAERLNRWASFEPRR